LEETCPLGSKARPGGARMTIFAPAKIDETSGSLRFPVAREALHAPLSVFRKFLKFSSTHVTAGLWAIFKIPSARDRNATLWLYLKFISLLLIFPLIRARKISEAKVLGATMKFADYGTFLGLISEILFQRIYSFKSSSASPLIFDAGSNIGMSILFFKRLYPRSRVMGFEPDPQTFELLQTNVRRNRWENVELHNKALHDSEGEINFYTDPDRIGSGKMSTVRERFPDSANRTVRCQTVETVRLSTFIREEIDLLKMDIEGAEIAVISELAESGRLRLINEMFIEYHHHLKVDEDNLSRMLLPLEENGFGYQISSPSDLPWARKSVQPMLIYAYRLS
jgi:FkbM family methyltransferase